MPLQAIKLKPGIDRESTSLGAEGTWYDCDKIRFRSGTPEKLGGWVKDNGSAASTALTPSTGSYWGICRVMWNWVTLVGSNLLALGTSKKLYIQDSIGGIFNDVTPLRETTAAGAVTFAAVNGSTTLTVTDVAHSANAGDFVTYSGAVSLGGVITATVLNAEFQVVTVLTANTYTITSTVTANSSDSGNGGGAVVAAYQMHVGDDSATPAYGWGAGGWGGYTYGVTSGWGSGTSTAIIRLWSLANYGQNLIANPRGGALYMWIPNAVPTIFDRASLLSSTSSGAYTTDADCPSVCNFVMVSDASRFVLAFGVNDYGGSSQDPMLVRWSDQEDYTVWTPAITNQAGSYRLSTGSNIITAIQTRQEVLVWTDCAIYSMQYLGPPYVWGTNILSDGISIVGMNAVAAANNIVFWMGHDKFYMYNGRVDTLPCTLRQFVFGDINLAQSDQFVAGVNAGYNEVWWFYCSSTATTNDRYVIYNYAENLWYYGTLARTAWLDGQLRTYPIATNYNGQVLYHDNGIDNGEDNPPTGINSYLQSADMDIGDGHNYGYITRIIPDVSFNGSTSVTPECQLVLKPRQNPGADYSTSGSTTVDSAISYATTHTYLVQQFTQIVYTRVRGRQMAFRIESSAAGTQWQLGYCRIDVRQDGRRA